MKKAGLPVPQMASGLFLVDTGASATCVDSKLIAALAIAPRGRVPIHTPSTNGTAVQCNQYDVAVYVPANQGVAGLFVDALPVIESDFSGQGIKGLIGRDIIDRCVMIYNGSLRTLTLSY